MCSARRRSCVGPCALGPAELCRPAPRAARATSASRLTSTRSTPISGCTAAVTSCVIRSRSGQPSIVSRTSTRTLPPSTAMPWSMPMSSIGLPISGSSTSRSACGPLPRWPWAQSTGHSASLPPGALQPRPGLKSSAEPADGEPVRPPTWADAADEGSTGKHHGRNDRAGVQLLARRTGVPATDPTSM